MNVLNNHSHYDTCTKLNPVPVTTLVKTKDILKLLDNCGDGYSLINIAEGDLESNSTQEMILTKRSFYSLLTRTLGYQKNEIMYAYPLLGIQGVVTYEISTSLVIDRETSLSGLCTITVPMITFKRLWINKNYENDLNDTYQILFKDFSFFARLLEPFLTSDKKPLIDIDSVIATEAFMKSNLTYCPYALLKTYLSAKRIIETIRTQSSLERMTN